MSRSLKPKNKTFEVDARTILQLGRQSIKDNTTALLELVKNSYDADASVVEVEIICNDIEPYIRIVDNGSGMTETDIDTSWLRIGYSVKRINRVSKRGRRKTGEKGVGRISADRLGSVLQLSTKATRRSSVRLTINWDDFDIEGCKLSSVPVRFEKPVTVNLPTVGGNSAMTGSELVIRGLRQVWSQKDIQSLYNELSVLTPPFAQVQDFEIYLKTDVVDGYNGLVVSSFHELAELELMAHLDGTGLQYTLYDRSDDPNSPRIQNGFLPWPTLVQRIERTEEVRLYPTTGPIDLQLLFFRREATDQLESAGFSLSDLREFLNKNAGIKIYRDNIRVRPYGDLETPEGDWLGLADRKTRDQSGPGRTTYRFAAHQIVGAVFLSRDRNPAFVDSAGREGLIHSDAYADLRALMLACLTLMEGYRHESFVSRRSQVTPDAMLPQLFHKLTTKLMTARSELQQLPQPSESNEAEVIARTIDQISEAVDQTTAASESIEELMTQSGVLRGLATLGIAASVFGHETQSALAQFISSNALVLDMIQSDPSEASCTIPELEKAKKAARYVKEWGSFSLARVKRDKRERKLVAVHKTLRNLVAGLRPVFSPANIVIETQIEEVMANLFEMDVEAIVINLLTNAYAACQQVIRERRVRIELTSALRFGRKGFRLCVSDSGPGVPEELTAKIWAPLVTFKKNEMGKEEGTGLGLTIVNSVVVESGGERSVDRSEDLGGARFCIWLPC